VNLTSCVPAYLNWLPHWLRDFVEVTWPAWLLATLAWNALTHLDDIRSIRTNPLRSWAAALLPNQPIDSSRLDKQLSGFAARDLNGWRSDLGARSTSR